MEPIVIALLILMLALAFGIGANDETMATLVGSRAVKPKYAIIAGGLLVSVGVIFLSSKVGKTIGAQLLGTDVNYNVYMLLAILISTTIWLVVASRTGAPISTTHSVVGAVFGIAIIWSINTEGTFLASLNWSKMGEIALGWVISPILGFLGAFGFQFLVSKFIAYQQEGLMKLEKMERVFGYLLILSVGWTQISRGGNDSANALGIMYGLIESNDVSESSAIYWIIATGVVLALGLIIIGRNVIKNVGKNLIEMRPSDAFSIQISTSIVLFLATILGLPVSGSHILIFAVIGAGRVKGEKPDTKSFRKMVLSWIITFPVAALLSGLIYGFILLII